MRGAGAALRLLSRDAARLSLARPHGICRGGGLALWGSGGVGARHAAFWSYWKAWRRSSLPAEQPSRQRMGPPAGKDDALVRLFMTACFHKWEELPAAAEACFAAGCSAAEVRGCIRHMCIFAGYAPCLAASKVLQSHGVLAPGQPGKAGGPPGDTFDRVYTGVADKVRAKLREVDPTLAEWLQAHAYGDVYSSPGLTLRQKQLLSIAFLGEANMHEELFGHVLAALRFGASVEECQAALRAGFLLSSDPARRPGAPSDPVFAHGMGILQGAARKHRKSQAAVAESGT